MNVKNLSRRDFVSKSSVGIMAAGAGLIGNSGSFEDIQVQEHQKIKSYRALGRTGFMVSDIGCGPAMMTNENLIKAVIDSGINVFDTAEFYGNGNNELLVGRGIKDFDRKSLFINTKLIISQNDDSEKIVTRVNKCLERLGTDYIDGFMLWNPATVEDTANKEFHKAVDQLRNEGKVKFCGISCHGSEYPGTTKDTMENIICSAVESGKFDHVLFVYNYAQQEMGNNILKACASKNVGALLMKTDPFGKRYFDLIDKVNALVKDGKSVDERTRKQYEVIIEKQKKGKEYLAEDKISDDQARREAAVNFVLDNPAVSSALISFTNFEEIPQYISLSGGKLREKDLAVIETMNDRFGHLYCRHACGICQSACPYNVPVNTIARFNNYFVSQKREKYAIEKYMALKGSKTEMCLTCEGYCEAACPYGVSTKTLMAVAHRNLNINLG